MQASIFWCDQIREKHGHREWATINCALILLEMTGGVSFVYWAQTAKYCP